ncbi:667_t:CDS:1 [Cetraspora pellucida]|uniref:667_t:CDS:1 n=1 Tax=Cetraspora pellucida TaxID=1433469 RepID=A0A9N9A9J5_9GLOM|nr:667_t:CDS:1 [Cetraspora pellucida]
MLKRSEFDYINFDPNPSDTCMETRPFIPSIIQNSIISNEQYTEESDEGHLFKGCSEDDEATLYLYQHDEDFSLSCQRSPPSMLLMQRSPPSTLLVQRSPTSMLLVQRSKKRSCNDPSIILSSCCESNEFTRESFCGNQLVKEFIKKLDEINCCDKHEAEFVSIC